MVDRNEVVCRFSLAYTYGDLLDLLERHGIQASEENLGWAKDTLEDGWDNIDGPGGEHFTEEAKGFLSDYPEEAATVSA